MNLLEDARNCTFSARCYLSKLIQKGVSCGQKAHAWCQLLMTVPIDMVYL